MTRSATLREEFSGLAEGRDSALLNPLRLISQPLYIPPSDEPALDITPWALIDSPSLHPTPDAFQRLIRSRTAFVPGGTSLVVEMALRASWYLEKPVRDDVFEAIKRRALAPLLDRLKDKDTADEIFGKTKILSYAKTLPEIDRRDEDSHSDRGAQRSQFDVWQQHPLRLRKVIEYILLTEKVLKWRFDHNEGKNRFSRLSGLPAHAASPEYVWDHLWIEPVIYVAHPDARASDIATILRDERRVTMFKSLAAQPAGALYWALRGVPGRFTTAKAACDVLNDFYTGDSARASVITVPPSEFAQRRRLVEQRKGLPLYAQEMEYLPVLGPRSIARDTTGGPLAVP